MSPWTSLIRFFAVSSGLLLSVVYGQCPSVWASVAPDLRTIFISGGKCTDDARAAIRLPFHDCFPTACDGSIILSNECTDHTENEGLPAICSILKAKTIQYNVSAADMIQVAAAVAIRACSRGRGPRPTIQVGRPDSLAGNPGGMLPSAADDATTLVSMFASRGLNSGDLVALVGAHSAGKNVVGEPFDSTVSTLDSTTFYTEVLNGSQPATLISDQSLATDPATADLWKVYAANQTRWAADFATAMEKMGRIGVNASSLVNCTDTIYAVA